MSKPIILGVVFIVAQVTLSVILSFVHYVGAHHGAARLIHQSSYTILRPGVYRVTKNLDYRSAEGACIRIEADNVVLDLNGHCLRCQCADAKRTCCGIYGKERKNVTIRNGRIERFAQGIRLQSNWSFGKQEPKCGWHRIERIQAVGNTREGIAIQGRCCIIRENVVSDTGPCFIKQNEYVYGIKSIGRCGRVLKNTVSNTVAAGRGEAVAISIDDSGNSTVIEGNHLTNRRLPDFRSIAVWVGHRSVVSVLGNHIRNFTWGITYSSPTRGLYQENIVAGCEVPICLCGVARERASAAARLRWVDAGSNVIVNDLCSSKAKHTR